MYFSIARIIPALYLGPRRAPVAPHIQYPVNLLNTSDGLTCIYTGDAPGGTDLTYILHTVYLPTEYLFRAFNISPFLYTIVLYRSQKLSCYCYTEDL